jgi:hypothetical protein
MLQNKRWSNFVIWMENEVSIVVLICHFAYSTLVVPFFITYSTFTIVHHFPLVIVLCTREIQTITNMLKNKCSNIKAKLINLTYTKPL